MPENRPSGLGVDSSGHPVIDPTANVQALSEASNKRQDDMRDALARRVDAEIATLKEYLRDILAANDKRYEQRYEASQNAVRDAFSAQTQAINAALASADRAVSKAEIAAEKRFEGVNEFRAQLGDQQRTLMPRTEAENRLNTLAEKIGVLEGFRTEQLSKGTGASEGYRLAIGVVGLLLVLLSIISVGILIFTRIGS
jgi:DNA-binding helix-hairpin-helix protein with protein kinase domain